MDSRAEKIALFRYGLIAPLVIEPLARGELTRRARHIAQHEYDFPFSNRRSISVDTLLDWALRYRREGIEALAPKPRSDRGHTRAITPELAQQIEGLKRQNPHLTGTAVLKQLTDASPEGVAPVSPTSLYRFLKKHGLTEQLLLRSKTYRKFEALYANQLWQSDMLYGPYVLREGGGRLQCFLYAVLDDASRLISHAQFYPHQGLDALLDCLRQAIAARGVPLRLYVDNAKVYRSHQLSRIAASLGMLVIHTPPYQPQGRGKIERFFRTVRQQFLAPLERNAPLRLEELNSRLHHWLETVYHLATHTGVQTTPLRRWQQDIEQVRQLPPHTDWRRVFFFRLNRRVRRDCTFLLQKRFYEAPVHLAGQTIEVRFDPNELNRVDVYFEGQFQTTVQPLRPNV